MPHKQISFTALGGAQEVGRSAFLIDSGDKFLLEYGVKLSPKETEYPLPVKTNINAAIISHAHLDHSGNLPHLFLNSHIMTFLTPPTLDLSKLLWFDSLKIAGMEGMDAKFSKEEIARTERYSFPIGYKKNLPVTQNASLEFFDAGHICGSALTKLSMHGKNLLYTGDFRVDETRLHAGADLDVGKVDYCVIEGTYGNRLHPERKHSEKHFVESVQEIVDAGGWALVPAFAVGRSQEVVDILNEYKLSVPVYLGGVCHTAAEVWMKYPEYLKNPKFLKKALDKVEWIRNDKMRAKALKQPSVIVTTSGMLTGGPIMQYLKRLYKDKDSKVFLTGYQVEETPGRRLLDTGKLQLNDVVVDAELQVEKFDFSAHADQKEMLFALKKWNPEKVIIVHGDKKVIEEFRQKLYEEGFDAVAAETGKTIKLH